MAGGWGSQDGRRRGVGSILPRGRNRIRPAVQAGRQSLADREVSLGDRRQGWGVGAINAVRAGALQRPRVMP